MSSLRQRVSLTVTAAVAALLVVCVSAVYLVVRQSLWEEFDRALSRQALTLAGAVEQTNDGGYDLEFADMSGGVGPTRPPFFQIWLPEGDPWRSEPLRGHGLPRAAGPFAEPHFQAVMLPGGVRGRMIGLVFVPRFDAEDVARPRPDPVTLAVAQETAPVEAVLALLRGRLLMTGGLLLLVAAGASMWSVARGLRPLGQLTNHLARMDETALDRPLPVEALPAELRAPVRKMNELLARLDQSFARERRFTADVSHELRTPLAGLRTTLEVSALRARSPEEYRATLVRAQAIVTQMQAMVENLLMMTRLDHGQGEVLLEDVGLRSLVDECWTLHAPRAAERRLTFGNEVPPESRLLTDREKLRIVIGNLLSNAASYTAVGGRITVKPGSQEGVILDVCDSGPDIPEADLPRVFDRFWRGDSARSDAGVHCGIGLPLAQALCALLGHSLTAENVADGGVRFRIARQAPGPLGQAL